MPVLIATGVGTVFCILAGLDWLLGATSTFRLFDPSLSGTIALSLLGAAISLFGVYLAIRIFAKQADRTRADNRHHSALMKKQQLLLAEIRQIADETRDTALGMDAKLSVVAKTTDAQPPDPSAPTDESVEPEDTEVSDASRIAYLDGERRAVFNPGDVPLWTIDDVMNKWTADGASGRWNLSSFIGAYRNISADNSFRGQPWVLVFENPDTEELEAWSVYRGGYAKKSATVAATQLPDPDAT